LARRSPLPSHTLILQTHTLNLTRTAPAVFGTETPTTTRYAEVSRFRSS
jgi:hypothetical protein